MLGQNICVKENLSVISIETLRSGETSYAGHIATIRCWMLAVIGGLHVTRIGTSLRVIALTLAEREVLVTKISPR